MKYPRQKKSRTYYYFWAFMALTVFFGQLYVGYGYRLMHGSILDLLGKIDRGLLNKDGTHYGDML